MTRAKAYQKRYAKARQRRRRTAQERLARDRRQAQQAAEALQHALDDLGLPDDLVSEIEGRLHSQHKPGENRRMMCPPLFGCRTNAELCRVRAGTRTCPPACSVRCPSAPGSSGSAAWVWKCWSRCEAPTASKSEATRAAGNGHGSDDSVFKSMAIIGLGRHVVSGQEHRVLSGIDGVLLVVVIGEGKLVVPVDFAIRRP